MESKKSANKKNWKKRMFCTCTSIVLYVRKQGKYFLQRHSPTIYSNLHSGTKHKYVSYNSWCLNNLFWHLNYTKLQIDGTKAQ